MKKIYLSFFFMIISIANFAQDTLLTKEGKKINCRVIEVRTEYVKYKHEADSEKQFSWIYNSKLNAIHYKNGTKDLFETLADSSSFRTTIINGKNMPNQPFDSKFDSAAEKENISFKKLDRHDVPPNSLMLGLYVIGFILKVALEAF